MSRARQGCAWWLGWCLALAVAQGQSSFPDQNPVSSLSEQFQISRLKTDPSLAPDPQLAADTNLVHLNTALLAVAAERFKRALWQQLGVPASTAWSGRIFIQLHPARSRDETVTIATTTFLNRWNYKVELPDALPRLRYARALSGVLLLELANRSAAPGGHAAELPAWLVDGLAQQVLAADGDAVVLSAPAKSGGLPGVGRVNRTGREEDALADARRVLQNLPVRSFDQLSQPTDAQMNGDDGGAYLAGAQVFVTELLELKNGRDKLRAFLADLPGHDNWPAAFYDAFGTNFHGALDVEKWWALCVVNLAAHAAGPRWTTAVSMARLDQLLTVPVEYRGNSNALPANAEISLQAALRQFKPAQRDLVVETKARDLALVELRLAPPFGNLAEGYRRALGEFLNDAMVMRRASAANKHGVPLDERMRVAEAIRKLDLLDQRRRTAEAHAVVHFTGNPAPGAR